MSKIGRISKKIQKLAEKLIITFIKYSDNRVLKKYFYYSGYKITVEVDDDD